MIGVSLLRGACHGYGDACTNVKSPPLSGDSAEGLPTRSTHREGDVLDERTHCTRPVTTRHAAGTGFQACDPIDGTWWRRQEAPRLDARSQPQHQVKVIIGGGGVGVRLPETGRRHTG